jgi:NAD(P)H-flavin reductase
MYTILAKQTINQNVKRLDIRADELVGKIKPGQFVAVMTDHFSRRVPFNVFEVDWRRKCLSVVFEENGPESVKMGALKINDELFSVSGPFGAACPVEKTGTVVCVGEGLGLGSLVALCRSLKQVGNKVIGIAGFETRKSSILENHMRLNCSKFYVMYKDGMHERRGDVLGPLKKVLAEETVARIYADASPGMIRDICQIAADKKVSVTVNLMPLVMLRPTFFETSHVILNGQRYYPALDGVVIDAAKMDLKGIDRVLLSAKEYSQCRQKDNASWDRPSAFARFKKFIWG